MPAHYLEVKLLGYLLKVVAGGGVAVSTLKLKLLDYLLKVVAGEGVPGGEASSLPVKGSGWRRRSSSGQLPGEEAT